MPELSKLKSGHKIGKERNISKYVSRNQMFLLREEKISDF